jgi:hypothetical protein
MALPRKSIAEELCIKEKLSPSLKKSTKEMGIIWNTQEVIEKKQSLRNPLTESILHVTRMRQHGV